MVASETQLEHDSTFRILISTDNHLGFKERDGVRGNDAFEVVEEILQLSTVLDVDFMLHGGDLFDLHKPSRSTLYRALCLFRTYCFRPQRISPTFRILNEATRAALFKFHQAHHEIPGHRVSLPIFSIHGNHDDPGGDAFLSSIDLLDASSMVTYFGWVDNIDDIHLHPILLEKGTTKIALYGLGNIRDERLHRAFQSGKVHFHEPEKGTRKDYFHLMVIHQNRYKGEFGGLPNKDCIHEQMLPNFLDLVVWGHEHDCVLGATEFLQAGFHVVQPGSSLPTSLTSGEALPKHVVVLEIRGDSFRSTFVPLRTVRPIDVSEVILEDNKLQVATAEAVSNFLATEVTTRIQMLERRWQTHLSDYERTLRDHIFPSLGIPDTRLDAFLEWHALRRVLGMGDTSRSAPLPLIRLRVEHSGYDTVAAQRFGSQFLNQVANPEDILIFFKKRKPGTTLSGSRPSSALLPQLEIMDVESAAGQEIQDLIFTFFEGDTTGLELLPEPDLNVAIQQYVHKLESSAIDQFVTSTIKTTQAVLRDAKESVSTPEDIRLLVSKLTDQARQCHVDVRQPSTTREDPNPTSQSSPKDMSIDLPDTPEPSQWLTTSQTQQQPVASCHSLSSANTLPPPTKKRGRHHSTPLDAQRSTKEKGPEPLETLTIHLDKLPFSSETPRADPTDDHLMAWELFPDSLPTEEQGSMLPHAVKEEPATATPQNRKKRTTTVSQQRRTTKAAGPTQRVSTLRRMTKTQTKSPQIPISDPVSRRAHSPKEGYQQRLPPHIPQAEQSTPTDDFLHPRHEHGTVEEPSYLHPEPFRQSGFSKQKTLGSISPPEERGTKEDYDDIDALLDSLDLFTGNDT